MWRCKSAPVNSVLTLSLPHVTTRELLNKSWNSLCKLWKNMQCRNVETRFHCTVAIFLLHSRCFSVDYLSVRVKSIMNVCQWNSCCSFDSKVFLAVLYVLCICIGPVTFIISSVSSSSIALYCHMIEWLHMGFDNWIYWTLTHLYNSWLQLIIVLTLIHTRYSSLQHALSILTLLCLYWALPGSSSSASVFSGFCPPWLASLSQLMNEWMNE
jgi:hypothetical protein